MERKTAEIMCAGGCGKMAKAGESLCLQCREQLMHGDPVWVNIGGQSLFNGGLKRDGEVRK